MALLAAHENRETEAVMTSARAEAATIVGAAHREARDRMHRDVTELRRTLRLQVGQAEAALQTARTESRRIHAEAQAELAAETDRRMNDLAERLQAESTQAAERIAAARDAALAEVRGVAVDLVQVAAERLIGTSIPADEARGAVERIAEGTR